MLCDELQRHSVPAEMYNGKEICGGFAYYDADEVDAAIAELKKKLMPCLNGDCILTCEVVEKYGKENAELKARIQLDDDEMAGFLDLEEECGGGDLRNYIAELKQKLEDVQASAYAESVDAGMENRRQKRALWLAREWRAWCEGQFWLAIPSDRPRDIYHLFMTNRIHRTPAEWMAYWHKVEQLCKKKAEAYK